MTKPVLLVRADGNQNDAEALAALGIETVIDPYISIEKATHAAGAVKLIAALANASEHTWLIATSANAIRLFGEIIGIENLRNAVKNPNLRFAAVGESTAKALLEVGARMVLTPEVADSASLAEMLLEQPIGTAVIPSGQLAMKQLPNALEAAGWNLVTGVVYTTVPVATQPASVAGIARGDYSAVIFRSPSAARSFLSFNADVKLPMVAAGFTTAKVIEDAGLEVASIPLNPTPEAVALAVQKVINTNEV
jgi:uroporphyrinogen-III synthase